MIICSNVLVKRCTEGDTLCRNSAQVSGQTDSALPSSGICMTSYIGPRGSVVGWGIMLQAGRSRVRFPMRLLYLFYCPNPSSRTRTLGSTQPLTEMSTRNLPVGKGWRAPKADNLTAICEPRRLTTLRACMACYRDSFTFFSLWLISRNVYR
jgi:hypothetical protein